MLYKINLLVAKRFTKESLVIHYRDQGIHKKLQECGFRNNSLAAEQNSAYKTSTNLDGITLSEVKSDYRTRSKLANKTKKRRNKNGTKRRSIIF